MATILTPSWLSLRWRLRRSALRRQLLAALEMRGGEMVPVRRLVRLAGLEDAPPRDIQAALSGLVGSGRIQGLRGANGWLGVSARPRFDEARQPPAEAPGASGASTRHRFSAARATASAAAFFRHSSPARRDESTPAGTAGGARAGGAAIGSAAVWPAPIARRDFSVMARLPRRQANGYAAGILLFLVAALAAAAGVQAIVRGGDTSETPVTPTTRAQWYTAAAETFIDGHEAGRIGFDLPYHFREIAGVDENAPRAALVDGMVRYIRAALFTGYPSETGLLSWARGEFGELPAGTGADAWMSGAAQTYTARALAGTPGYDLTPAILTAGALTPNERDPAAVAAGVQRTLRAALYLGTPDTGGILDWARRTIGELPAE